MDYNKQPYDKPTIEMVTFATEDVIRTSETVFFEKKNEGSGNAYSAEDLF